jgi:uncharacterized protein YegJ (DUF2314 family)
MRLHLGVLAVVVLSAAGCAKQSPVTRVARDDPRMNAAIQKARTSVGSFTAALKSPKPGATAFSVKAPFTDGTNTEHMWLTSVTFDGKLFHGAVNNKQEKVANVKFGDKVTVPTSQISDWMYVQNHKLIGGYTLRALRDALPASEQIEFDKSVPFTVD